MFFASASAHLIEEDDGNVPKGNEVEAARAAFGIVDRTIFTALRADGQTVFARDDFDSDVLRNVSYFTQMNFFEDEGLVIGQGIEYSLDEHLDGKIRKNVDFANNILTDKPRDRSFFAHRS